AQTPLKRPAEVPRCSLVPLQRVYRSINMAASLPQMRMRRLRLASTSTDVEPFEALLDGWLKEGSVVEPLVS
ncbi:hypothetical protein AK812_SmicGene41958, partial [Symbiodinium microadriaticum]